MNVTIPDRKTQVIFNKIIIFIDKYAKVDTRGNIVYSLFNKKSRTSEIKRLSKKNIIKIYNELYKS